jgi:hypothetical protein
MSFSYNLIIDSSKSKDIELNTQMNNIILDANSNRKKSSQEEIDNMLDKLSNKIFDVIVWDKNNYFWDKELNLIWDENTNIIGFVNLSAKVDEPKYVFWRDIDNIVSQMNLDEIEYNQIIKTLNLQIK